jgi:hypothetical protein
VSAPPDPPAGVLLPPERRPHTLAALPVTRPSRGPAPPGGPRRGRPGRRRVRGLYDRDFTVEIDILVSHDSRAATEPNVDSTGSSTTWGTAGRPDAGGARRPVPAAGRGPACRGWPRPRPRVWRRASRGAGRRGVHLPNDTRF